MRTPPHEHLAYGLRTVPAAVSAPVAPFDDLAVGMARALLRWTIRLAVSCYPFGERYGCKSVFLSVLQNPAE